MAVAIQDRKPALLTYEQYLDDLLSLEEHHPREIIDGVRRYLSSPGWIHQQIILQIFRLIDKYRATAGGKIAVSPSDVVIRRLPLRVRQPDLLYISAERLAGGGGVERYGPLTTPPELVIEIRSPTETKRDINEKIADYQQLGVNECWIVEPELRTVAVLRLTANEVQTIATYFEGDILISDAMSGLEVSVNEIFAED